jgi:hypothetical protein
MAKGITKPNSNLDDFVDLLNGLRGVVEVKVVSDDERAWIGLRTGPSRPATPLLQQVSRAAVGYGFDAKSIQFGILAD